MKRNLAIAALVLITGLGTVSTGETATDHLAFAAKADSGDADQAACRKNGGQNVNGSHRNVVITMGRRDAKLENVIHYADRAYVTYRIATPTLFGTTYAEGLCHF